MKCQILVRVVEGVFAWQADAWLALQLICCAAAEPRTREQLADALRPSRPELHLWEHAVMIAADALPAPPPVGIGECWCFIDYLSRTVICSHTFPDLPCNSAILQWKPHPSTTPDWCRLSSDSPLTSRVVLLHLPQCWKFYTENQQWQRIVARRYQGALQEPLIDVDFVLWGAPLFEWISRAVYRVPASRDFEKVKRQLHRDWLYESVPGLAGYPNYTALWGGTWYAEQDLELRQRLWQTTGYRPAPLPASSPAFHYGPYAAGHDLLHYYYFQTLLDEAWRCRQQGGSAQNGNSRVAALERRAEAWWQEPFDQSLTGLTHREVWMRLRRRDPLTIARHALPVYPWLPPPNFELADWAFECFGYSPIFDELDDGYSVHTLRDTWFPWVWDEKAKPGDAVRKRRAKLKCRKRTASVNAQERLPHATQSLATTDECSSPDDTIVGGAAACERQVAVHSPWSQINEGFALAIVRLRDKPAMYYWIPSRVVESVE